jgi:oligopeptide transport system substrate-binding protein
VASKDFKYAWLRAMDPETRQASTLSYPLSSSRPAPSSTQGGGRRGRGHQNARRQDIQGYTRPSDAILPWLEGFLNPPPAQRTFVEKQYGEFAQSAEAILYSGFHTVSEFDPATSATFVRT